MGQLWSGCGVLVLAWSRTGPSMYCSSTGPAVAAMGQLWGAGTGPVQGAGTGPVLVPAGTGSVLVLPKQLWGASTGLVLVPAGTGPVEAAIGQRWGAGTSPVLVLVGAGPVLVQQKRL